METKLISSPAVAVEMMQTRFNTIDHEELWGIFVGLRNEQVACKLLSRGGWTSTTIDLRQIFSIALENKAVGIILFHNHLSDSPKPSVSDMTVTDRIRMAAMILEISLVDHIIIAGNQYFSFADEVIRTIKRNNQ
jgi:DNA repair protein RadC